MIEVLDGRPHILEDPGIVGIPDTVFLANFTDSGSNEGVPGTRHAGEQMMLHLEIQPPRDASRDEPTIRRRCLDLRFEPTYRLTALTTSRVGRVPIYVLKVVGQGKEDGQG